MVSAAKHPARHSAGFLAALGLTMFGNCRSNCAANPEITKSTPRNGTDFSVFSVPSVAPPPYFGTANPNSMCSPPGTIRAGGVTRTCTTV